MLSYGKLPCAEMLWAQSGFILAGYLWVLNYLILCGLLLLLVNVRFPEYRITFGVVMWQVFLCGDFLWVQYAHSSREGHIRQEAVRRWKQGREESQQKSERRLLRPVDPQRPG